MNVSLVTTSFPLTGNSTSGVFILKLAEEIAKRVSLKVITPAGEQPVIQTRGELFTLIISNYAPTKWRVLTHRPGGIPAALKHNPYLYILLPFLLLGLFAICLKTGKSTDLYHANWSITGVVAGLAAKITGKPCVTTLRGSDVNRALSSTLYRLVLKLCLRLSSHIVTVSDGIRDHIVELFPAYKNSISVIPNGVDVKFFNVESDANPRDTLNIVCVGNLTENKSIDTTIRATARLKDNIKLHLTIVGDGPQRDNLVHLVEELDISPLVTFTGVLLQEEIIRRFSHSDIFVHASLSEGRPNVVLEAMAAGLPVIASEIPGIVGIIQNRINGLTFKPRDSVELANLISLLAKDHGLKTQLSTCARNYISEHNLTWEASANQYFHLYEKLLNQT